ncbi:MAG: efflux RND transporter periplasmic adaptor subunit [Bacteroidetes bacterium]|nr:efflux RND transporter periplasmic adaptor subunit [Bacteroidota bacterium]
MKRIIIISIFALVLIILAALKLFSNKEEAKTKIFERDPSTSVLVETVKPIAHTFESSLSFLGTFDANLQNFISSESGGKLISLNVKEGDAVREGQLIAKLDNELILLQIETAKLSINQLKFDHERLLALKKENIVSANEFEKVDLGLKTAELQLKQLQRQLKSTNILAPFSGVVSKKMVDLGSMIAPGTPIVELIDISALKLTVSVPERDILKFEKGQKIIAKADIHGSKTFEGEIKVIGIQADAAHNYKVQASVTNSTEYKILAGMYGSLSLINSSSLTALSIPRKALIGSTKKPQVYVVKNGKSVLTNFNSGTSDGDYIEVISGLTSSDEIVVKGQVNLQDNGNVKIK